jgi:hypothetical protein
MHTPLSPFSSQFFLFAPLQLSSQKIILRYKNIGGHLPPPPTQVTPMVRLDIRAECVEVLTEVSARYCHLWFKRWACGV